MALFETCMVPADLSIAQLAGCLAYLKAGDFNAAAARYRKMYELEGVSARSINQLISLWVKAPDLQEKIYTDINHLLENASIVIPLR